MTVLKCQAGFALFTESKVRRDSHIVPAPNLCLCLHYLMFHYKLEMCGCFLCVKNLNTACKLVSVIICVLFQSSGYRGWNPKPGCRRGMENLIMSPLSISLQLSSNRLVVLSGCECVGPYEDETERSVHAQ